MRRFWVGVLLLAVALPALPEPAAACSPRTFSSIQPPADPAPAPVPQVEEPPAPPPEEPPPPPPEDPPPADPPPAEEPPPPAEEPPPPAPEPPGPWTPPPPVCNWVYRMEFPVLGGNQGWSLFGEPRDGGARLHAGVDIIAPKLTPVVAVRSGTILGVHDTPGDCCWVSIRHSDGWISMYVHLNNDTLATDDGRGIGIRPDLVEGQRITQGEVIGWIGDSGNAETAVPHVHFELRTPWGEPVDPGPSLYRARRRASTSLGLTPAQARFDGTFVDDDDSHDGVLFDMVSAIGVPAWCDDWAVRACPADTLDQLTVSVWLAHLGGSPDIPREYYAARPVEDPTAYLSLLAECVDPTLCGTTVTRGEVAALVLRTQIPDRVFSEAQATAVVHNLGYVDGCHPHGPDPDEVLSRGAALRMLLRAFGYIETPPCGSIT